MVEPWSECMMASSAIASQLTVTQSLPSNTHHHDNRPCFVLLLPSVSVHTWRKKLQTGMSAGAWACCSGHAGSLHCPASQPGQTATLLASCTYLQRASARLSHFPVLQRDSI